MKIFSTWTKFFSLHYPGHYPKTSLMYYQKYVFRFFISIFDQKLQPSKVGLKMSKNWQKQAKWTHLGEL